MKIKLLILYTFIILSSRVCTSGWMGALNCHEYCGSMTDKYIFFWNDWYGPQPADDVLSVGVGSLWFALCDIILQINSFQQRVYWCAILIAHQIVMAKHGGSCVHFSGISTCGKTSPETVSHPQRQPLPTAYKISLPVHVIVTNKRLQLLATTLYNSLVLSFSLLKSSRRLISHRAFCATCVVDGGALSFADGRAAVVCSTSLMASLIGSMKHPLDVVRIGSWNSLGLQK